MSRPRARRALSVGAIALVSVSVTVAALLTIGSPAGTARAQEPPTDSGLRVYVIVLDSLMPHEVTPTLMPNLSALRAEGTWYEQARSVFIAETLPNHASMMTGVLPERHGIVANRWNDYNWGITSVYNMDNPSLLKADTLTTRLENQCDVSTATVVSKEYLFHLLHGEPYTKDDPNDPDNQVTADFHWDPRDSPGYISKPDDHAVDLSTMHNGFLPWLETDQPTPQFAFVNLGDIDRSGHIDESGALVNGGVTAFRQAVMTDTDTLLGEMVDELKQSGAWDETVLIFTSDHGMNWSLPQNHFFMYTKEPEAPQGSASFEGHPEPNGGAGMIYVRRQEDIAPIAKIYAAEPSVDFVATRESIPELDNPTLHEMGIDNPNAGDIVLFMKPGWRVGDESNFVLPGNHGNPVTQHSTLMVSGGHPVLDEVPESVPGEKVYDPQKQLFAPPTGGPGNLSIAPTVASLFGIGEPEGGYDGAPLTEAFDHLPLATNPACAQMAPDMSLDITDNPDPVKNGHVLTYTLTVKNDGTAIATGVTVIDDLPMSVKPGSISSTQGSCSILGQTVTCALADLAPGESRTVTIEVRARRREQIVNSGSVILNETDANGSNNQDTETTEVGT